MRLVRFVVSIS